MFTYIIVLYIFKKKKLKKIIIEINYKKKTKKK